jgi:hypothetical protein
MVFFYLHQETNLPPEIQRLIKKNFSNSHGKFSDTNDERESKKIAKNNRKRPNYIVKRLQNFTFKVGGSEEH